MIALPTGGGALRGIGEKFSANPVTGTASMTVPIATSPGRGGFGPALELSYDSGNGNGAFGFGWSLSLPSITRKTDKGVPQYRDASESDVFLIAGSEDLVPVMDAAGERFVDERMPSEYEVHRYRPRVEGLFARIERWTRRADGDVHWRVLSRDNVASIYGRTSASRVADPEAPRRTFSWLLCESYDNKGNAIVYEYASEDAANVDLSLGSERHRARTAGRYLKRVKYGNRRPVAPDSVDAAEWLFEVVLDYGEGHLEVLPFDPALPPAEQHPRVRASYLPAADWAARPDPFSGYRSGFEVRTHRRCQRVLMFHRFDELTEAQGLEPYLVSATELEYDDLAELDHAAVDLELGHLGSTRFASFIRRVVQTRFVRDDAALEPASDRGDVRCVTYRKRSLPPLEFGYEKAKIQDELRVLDAGSASNLPRGVDGSEYRWVDLDGEGLSGILTREAEAWFYKPNLGDGNFGPMLQLPRAPNPGRAGATQLMDLSGNGQLDVVAFDGPLPGFFERTRDHDWEPYKAFSHLPRLNWSDPNLRFLDVSGDGHADVLITEDDILTWYPSREEQGFDPARYTRKALDEDDGPRLLFADGTESIYLADLSGDGLTDIVRIRNGEVCYWPNLGYGHFGAKVVMDNGPHFDAPDRFDQKRIRLADVDGSGTVDILYLHQDGVRIYFNQSGNRWTDARPIRHLPPFDDLSSVTVVDLLGNGTACLVWSSALPAHAHQPLRYVDLMGGQKPHLLISIDNNLGATTEIEYAASTRFYLADKRAGKPWVTRLPFPVHCVTRVTAADRWRKTRFSTSYSYHHGFFDGREREFRGFGRVEQVDSERYGEFSAGNAGSPFVTDDHELYQPPVKTVTWYHTGAVHERGRILRQFEQEYFPRSFEAADPSTVRLLGDFQENILPEPDLDAASLTSTEHREALRACKGMPLRQEIYELDVDALARGEERLVKLFSTAYHNCRVRMLQPKAANRHAVFLVTESEAISYHYELDLRGATLRPDPRVAHTLNLRVDAHGNVLQSVAVGYPRFAGESDPALANPLLPSGTRERIQARQGELHITYVESRIADPIDEPNAHRLGVPCEVQTFELTGLSPEDASDNRYFALEELRRLQLSERYPGGDTPVATLPYHVRPDESALQKREVEHLRVLFFDDALSGALPLGRQNALGLVHESYRLALTDALLDAVLGPSRLDASVRADLDDPGVSGYFQFSGEGGRYWLRSGSAGFAADARDHFYLPERYTDAFGHTTQLHFDDKYDLYLDRSVDPVGNTIELVEFDFRVLSPLLIQDPNDNLSAASFDILGLPIASAVMGKGSEADRLDSAARHSSTPAESARVFSAGFDEALLRRLLGSATARHVHSFGEVVQPDGSIVYGTRPPASCAILRETHVARLAAGTESRLQIAFVYSDGSGNQLVTKALAEAAEGESELRWLASGKTVLNNKGKPVKQYEPYFSPSGHRYEEPLEVGVTSIVYYDAPGRVIRTEQPDGSYARVEFSPWRTTSYDANDTLLEAGNQWYASRRALPASSPEYQAAQQAEGHAGTPSTVFLDSLGRDVIAVEHNRYHDRRGVLHDELYVTETRLDPEGKPLYVRDARGNLVMQYITPALADDHEGDLGSSFTPCFDIAGNLLFEHSMDGGDRWMLSDAAGQPLYAWDVNERILDTGERIAELRTYRHYHDALHRPLGELLRVNDDPPRLLQRWVHGESADRAKERNLRGQLYRHFDGSGLVSVNRYDFQGRQADVERRLVRDTRAAVIDWGPLVLEGDEPDPRAQLETDTFHKYIEHDAIGRMVRLYNWHRDPERVVVYEPSYDQRGTLEREVVYVRARVLGAPGSRRRDGGTAVPAVSGVRYNEKGQRIRIQHGNGTVTRREFDPRTFRLRQLRTTRPGYEPAFPEHHAGLADAHVLQQLHYTYDAMGNVTEVNDEAFSPVFFNHQEVQARSRYRYDALYRLIAASGREDASVTSSPVQLESRLEGASFPRGSSALRNYTEYYGYDSVGNISELAHRVPSTGAPDASDPPSWTREYTYAPNSNRLLQTRVGSGPLGVTDYQHDTHGSLLNFANVAPEFHVRWDHRDMIRALNLGGGGFAHYNYDAGKQRTRKVLTHQAGFRQWERIYLGGAELYRGFDPSGELEEEIETHHLFVDDERVLIIDDVLLSASDDYPSDAVLYRYQHGNHLGSVSAELDESGNLLSYEEYHPYGTPAFRARGSGIRATRKRYRYTGMERDDESGLSYHTARYYLPWLGRWGSVDPAGLVDGVDRYSYARSNPAQHTDRGGNQTDPQTEYLDRTEAAARSFGNPRLMTRGHDRTRREGTLLSRPAREWAQVRILGHIRRITRSPAATARVEDQIAAQRLLPGASQIDFHLGVTIALRESGSHVYLGRGSAEIMGLGEGGLDYLIGNLAEVGALEREGLISSTTAGHIRSSHGVSFRRDELLTIYNAAVGMARIRFGQAAEEEGYTQQDISRLTVAQRQAWVAMTYATPGTDARPAGGVTWDAYARSHRGLGTRTVLSLFGLLGARLSDITNMESALHARIQSIDNTKTLRLVAGVSERAAGRMSLTQLRTAAERQVSRLMGSRRVDVAMRTAAAASAMVPPPKPRPAPSIRMELR